MNSACAPATVYLRPEIEIPPQPAKVSITAEEMRCREDVAAIALQQHVPALSALSPGDFAATVDMAAKVLCLSDAAYTKLVRRDAAKQAHIERLEALLHAVAADHPE